MPDMSMSWKFVPTDSRQLVMVSDHGLVRIDGELVTPYQWSGSGESFIRLWVGGVQKSFYIHRLVAQAFVENDHPKTKKLVARKDGDRTNNAASNLFWCTRGEMIRTYEGVHGKDYWKVNGRRNSPLTPENVRQIRKQYAAGRLGKTIAYEFGITPATVSRIALRQTWKDIQ